MRRMVANEYKAVFEGSDNNSSDQSETNVGTESEDELNIANTKSFEKQHVGHSPSFKQKIGGTYFSTFRQLEICCRLQEPFN